MNRYKSAVNFHVLSTIVVFYLSTLLLLHVHCIYLTSKDPKTQKHCNSTQFKVILLKNFWMHVCVLSGWKISCTGKF